MNPFRGESPLVVDGRAYTLMLDFNALCIAESALGIDIDEIIPRYERGLSLTLVRGLVWAALQRVHPEITLDMTGDLIAQAGLPVAREALNLALTNAFGGQAEKEGAKNPPKRGRAGTGPKV